MIINRFLFSVLLCFIFNNIKATDIEPDSLIHKGDNHEHHNNEIGIAQAPVLFLNEKEFSYGLHIHYLHTIKHSKFGIGVGYERIFDSHGHNTFGLVASYRPADKLSFILSPGIAFEDASSSSPVFALHAETAYEFEIRNFHLGPVLEFAYDNEDIHISLGLHIGFGF